MPKHLIHFGQTFLFSLNSFTQKKECSELWVTKHIIKAGRNTARNCCYSRQGAGEVRAQRSERKHRASTWDTALLSCFVSWSPVVNKVMSEKQWDQGSLTFFHMQQTVPCAVTLYSKVSLVASQFCLGFCKRDLQMHFHRFQTLAPFFLLKKSSATYYLSSIN